MSRLAPAALRATVALSSRNSADVGSACARLGMRRLGIALAGLLALTGALAPTAHAFKPSAEFGHVGIVRDGMTPITRPSSDGSRTYRFSEKAILEVRDATAGVDEIFSSRGEFADPVAHCDNELLPECSQRLIDLKNSAIAALTGSSPDGAQARRQTARALHTLQDFYSHSNWIELGNAGANLALGRSTLGRLAGNQQTCGAIASGTLTAFGLTNLTTGYFTVVIPFRKCAHGIPVITAGIHKDEPGRAGHAAARAAAVASTTDFVNQILDAPGVAGNDKAIRAYMDVRGTLGFVIDDTGSMGPIINGVKSVVSSIVTTVAASDQPPDEYLLVRFGDPDVGGAFVTPDAPALLGAVNGLFASGGGDCPELAMSGMLNAVEAALPDSSLYLFTDASAKDSGLVGNVIATALAKNIALGAVISGSCSPIDPAYRAMVQATGGQLFQTAHTAADTAKVFDVLKPSLAGDQQLIASVAGTASGSDSFTAPIDSTVSAATFAVAMDDKGTITVRRPDGSAVLGADPDTTITDLAGARIVTVTSPAAGTWRVEIVGGSGSYSATVSGNSSIRFADFSFVELRGREGHQGLFPILGQPTVGGPLAAKANVFGPATGVDFELRTEAGVPVGSTDLLKGASVELAADDFYGTVTLPAERVRIYATGIDANGNAVQRSFPATFRAQSVRVDAPASPPTLVAGETSTATFEVTNLGSADTFDLRAADATGFATGVSPSTVDLGAGESRTIDVTLTVPAGTPDGTLMELSLVAGAASDSAIRNNAVIGLLVGPADKQAPTTLAAVSPTPNDAGWNRGDVTVHIGADDAGGSGVSSLTYSASGAQQIDETRVSTDSAAVEITKEGETTISYAATDRAGNAEDSGTIVVRIDRTDPELRCAVSPARLPPANDELVDVTASVDVSDGLSGPDGFVLTSVTSSEPAAAGDIDAFTLDTPDLHGRLRARASTSGDGRVYTLTYAGTDVAGNRGTCTVRVDAPKGVPGSVTPKPSEPPKPSNAFAFPAVTVRRSAAVRLHFSASGPGVLHVLETATIPAPGFSLRGLRPGNGRFTFGSVRRVVRRRQVVRPLVLPTHAGARLRDRHRRLRIPTRVRLVVTWTPAGGDPRTKVKTIVIRTDRLPRHGRLR